MKKVLAISLVLLVAIVTTAAIARAKEIERTVPMLDDPSRGVPNGRVFGVNTAVTDTFWYGGTQIIGGNPFAVAPGAAGWTNRKMWTWSSAGYNGTPHSGLNMDGWKGVDNTAQTDNYFYVADNATMGGTCAIAGTKSLFCGVTNAQSIDLCYVDQIGTGYGNNWSQTVVTKTYTYNVGDAITLTYKYNNESEPGYDFTDVILQTWDSIGGEWINYDTLAEYTDLVSGTEPTINVAGYMSALTPPIDFRIRFTFSADGGYSDEDGNFPTTCGGVEIDDYVLTINATPDSENFEGVANGSLPAGWLKVVAGCGDYAHTKHVSDLPILLSQDPCVASIGSAWCEIADSVLVFYDELNPSYPHPLCQDNFAKSPVIDFAAHAGLPGRFGHWERFGSLPLNEYIFMYWQVRYKPGCASGGWSPWLSDNYVYYTSEGTSCRPFDADMSTWVPPEAEQAQISVGVINYCDEDPWGYGDCTYTDNVTPYFDNVTFGVFGSNVAPFISMRELDYWQDQFAEDGTLNPLSTADTRTPNYQSNFTAAPIFGDSLNARASGTDVEVYLVFRMAKVSPLQPTTAPFFTWFPGVTGGGWKEARMDTTEVTNSAGTGTVLVAGRYASNFHEADATRIAFGLPELTEILSNNIFVPGTRIEYFLKSKYTGGGGFYNLPDTTGGVYEEFEVLPMYRSDGLGGVEWPCLIVADHFGQRGNWFRRNSDRIGSHLAANGYVYDTYSKLGPSSALLNGIGRYPANTGQIGGPGTDKYNWGSGATLIQMLAYTHAMLNSGNIYAYSMVANDVSMLSSWLNLYTSSSRFRFFWASGDQLARELNRRLPWGKTFLNGTLGTTYVASSYATQNNDYTYCLPINGSGLGGVRLTGGSCPSTYVIRQNGCPRLFNVVGTTGSGAVAEKQFDTRVTPRYSVVSNVVAPVGGANYKTVYEGYDNCTIRTNGSLGFPECGTDAVMTTWFACVLGFGSYSASSFCNPSLVGVDPLSPAPPAVVSSLASAYPNPMNPTATLRYTVGTPGKVMLRVFDVTGRVIRTLVDETQPTGAYSVIWDGSNDRGEKVASGVFFYQLNAPGFSGAKKIVILQ